MMQNRPQEQRNLEQTNQDSATGIQANTQGGTSYIAREINIYGEVPSSSANGAGEEFIEPPQNIPPSNAAQFVGRDRELMELHQFLQQGNVVAIADATGQGGVGKTELAVQYCLHYLAEYPGGICWLFPKTSDIGMQIVEFARVQFPNFQIAEGLSLLNQVNFCWRRWIQSKTLLVIDNVTAAEYEQIRAYLPLNSPRFKIVLTTRERLRVPLQLPLNTLEKIAAMELLTALMGEALMQQEANFAERLCDLVGCSPLALHVVAGHIKPEAVAC